MLEQPHADLSLLFADGETALAQAELLRVEVASFVAQADGPGSALAFLPDYDRLSANRDELECYVFLRLLQDPDDEEAHALELPIAAALAEFDLLTHPFQTTLATLEADEAAPPWSAFLDELRRERPYVLPTEVERAVAAREPLQEAWVSL